MTRTSTRSRVIAALLALGLTLVLAQASSADRGRARGRSAQDAQLTLAKEATAAFATPAGALAAGYVPASPCIESPFGIMGFHYVNPAIEASGIQDVTRPPELTYVPTPGGLVLGALEYHKNDADQNLATDYDRPSLFGIPFDGPMPGHGPPANPGPIHYDLHVWLGQFNPNGIFQQWNPRFRCPA